MSELQFLELENLINQQKDRLHKIVQVIDLMEELLEKEREELASLYERSKRHIKDCEEITTQP